MQHIDPAHRRTTPRSSLIVWDASPVSLLATAGALHHHGYACTCARTAEAAIAALSVDEAPSPEAIVIDIGDDATAALFTLETIRSRPAGRSLPAVLIAQSGWAGLEKKAETMTVATRCLFKPIDPNALLAVVDQLLWMPTVVEAHRRRGSKPRRPGWVTLSCFRSDDPDFKPSPRP